MKKVYLGARRDFENLLIVGTYASCESNAILAVRYGQLRMQYSRLIPSFEEIDNQGVCMAGFIHGHI